MYDLDQTFLSNNFLHQQIFDNSATQSAWSSPPFSYFQVLLTCMVQIGR